MADSISIIPVLPSEIIKEILLKLPPNSLLRCMCVSKSWLQLISSPHFVKTHLKLTANDKGCSYHRVLFRGLEGNFKFCCLPSLFYKEQSYELLDMDSPVENPTFSAYIVGSTNGLICLFKQKRETFLWNPTIRKSKELPKLQGDLTLGCSYYCKHGFGYDELHDDYKVVYIDYYGNSSYINIYSLRTDSWRTVNALQDIFLVNSSGKFVNGKLYWASSTGIGINNVCNIISFDLADETWGKLELPSCGEVNSHVILGVVGSDLSLIYTSRLGTTTSDVWIMKDCGVNGSWTKLFTIKYPQSDGLYMCSPIFTFSIHFHESNKGEFLLFLPPLIMIYDCSTGQLEHADDVKGCPAKIYVESLVNPLTISGQGRRSLEASQSLSR